MTAGADVVTLWHLPGVRLGEYHLAGRMGVYSLADAAKLLRMSEADIRKRLKARGWFNTDTMHCEAGERS